MIATIIYPDIVMYTKRIQDELGICKEKYPEYIFREDGLVVDPMKREGVTFAVEGAKEKDSFAAALDVLDIFKDWGEYNKGWDTIQGAESSKREKIVHRLIHLGPKNHISANDLDISFEPDAGRGPVDLKVSRGGDKTIVEIKLSTNIQYLHGYEEQIKEYGKAECTDKMIYVFVDFFWGGARKIKKDHRNASMNLQSQKEVPGLMIIDATAKNAASTYSD